MFVITGGGSGIGRSLAIEIAKHGHDVLIIGRNQKKLLEVTSLNPNISYFCADVSNQEDRLLIKQHLQKKQIKGLVNNAGIIQPIVKISDISVESWHHIMATNLDAPLFLTTLLKTNLRDGRVLNIGSGAAHFAIFGWTAYCVSKAALFRLTECLRLEEKNIAFASVMPGIIDTNMQKEIRDSLNMNVNKRDFFQKLYNEEKLLKPDVVASFLSWLLLEVDSEKYASQEWDIYDKSHHNHWLQKDQHVPEA